VSTRIPPLPPGQQAGEVAELLGSASGDGALFVEHSRRPPLNVFTIMARHPRLYRLTTALAQYLTNGLLPARDRELAVLRTAVRCGSLYEWAHHLPVARAAQVSEEEIAHLARGTGSWTEHEQALLAAVDELHHGSTITPGTWQILARRYSEQELIELIMLVGEYHKIAFFLNATGTPLDDWVGDIHGFHD
jgi:4-carboxymuconolactone decarboxylase